MTGEVEHGVVGARLVTVRLGDQGARIVGHDQCRHATIKRQGAHRRVEPVGHRFTFGGAGERIAGCPHRGDVDMGATAIGQGESRAGEVDEQLLAAAVDLPHGALEPFGEVPVVLTELRIAVGLALGVFGPVLLPQQHERHALASQFVMDAPEVGLHMVTRLLGGGQQASLQRHVVERLDSGPVQPGCSGQADIFGHDAFGQIEGGSDLLVRQPGVKFQTQYFLDLTHSDPRCGHACPRQKIWQRTRRGCGYA